MTTSLILKKKICMLGSYAVGKTSLVRHYVEGIFSEKYQITIGVKIDKKTIALDDCQIKLMLWDVAGEEENFTIPPSYLKGMHGFLLVMDGTRASTYEQAVDICERAVQTAGDVPFVAVLNKSDLKEDPASPWEFTPEMIKEIEQKNWPLILSSAKSGMGVEDAFQLLSKMMVNA